MVMMGRIRFTYRWITDMPRNLDTGLLRAFVTVAETGGMTAAGQALNLTQAAISQQIKRLEESLGTVLIERTRRDLSPTPEGERLLSLAKRLLAINDEIWAEMTSPVERGEVRLGIPYDLVPGYMPGILKRFNRCCPQTHIKLICLSSKDIRAALTRGEIDIGIVEELETGPGGETLMIDRLVWVGAIGGDAHQQRPMPISIGSETCSIRSPVLTALRQAGINWQSVSEISNMDALNATVYSDLAITAMLASTIPPGLTLLPADCGLPSLPHLSINLYIAPDSDSRAMRELARAARDGFLWRREAAVA